MVISPGKVKGAILQKKVEQKQRFRWEIDEELTNPHNECLSTLEITMEESPYPGVAEAIVEDCRKEGWKVRYDGTTGTFIFENYWKTVKKKAKKRRKESQRRGK